MKSSVCKYSFDIALATSMCSIVNRSSTNTYIWIQSMWTGVNKNSHIEPMQALNELHCSYIFHSVFVFHSNLALFVVILKSFKIIYQLNHIVHICAPRYYFSGYKTVYLQWASIRLFSFCFSQRANEQNVASQNLCFQFTILKFLIVRKCFLSSRKTTNNSWEIVFPFIVTFSRLMHFPWCFQEKRIEKTVA